MTKYNNLQNTFNAQHNWALNDPEAIKLSALQIIETLQTSEQQRLMELPEHLDAEMEWMGERILGNIRAHLRGEQPFWHGSSVEHWAQNHTA